MKKIKEKLIKKLNQSGSGVILVVVALAFISILVGSLLTAVGYAYKQKLYDYNAKDNFYYLEQAMDEVYAMLGARTEVSMVNAYNDTVEAIVYYDMRQNSYVTLDDAVANSMFKTKFMENVYTEFDPVNSDMVGLIEGCISNESVKLINPTRIKTTMYDADGNVVIPAGGVATDVAYIRVENITLQREAEYNRSQANGTFKQTISTDIEIAKPDFDVQFNTSTYKFSTVFDYALVADNGVEVNQTAAAPLTIKGNVYAASDFYNKDYNYFNYPNYTNMAPSDDDEEILEEDGSYNFAINSVYNGARNSALASSTQVNQYQAMLGVPYAACVYDGVNPHSMYSGFMVNGGNVSILADTVCVPGTIAVLDSGNLSVYSKDGKFVSETSVWCDNFVLGGSSNKTIKSVNGNNVSVYNGAQANIRANLYVSDDLQIDANGSKFSIFGSYFGYGNGTESLTTRTYINTVKDSVLTREHFNSSAIIINGENSTLDLSNLNSLFIAGRSYIEMSKKVTESSVNNTDGSTTVTKTYEFDKDINDYKTGESLSVKSNQLAYIPASYVGAPKAKTETYNGKTYEFEIVELSRELKNAPLFLDHFGNFYPSDFENAIPVYKQVVSGKTYYYYNFQVAYMLAQKYNNDAIKHFGSADGLAAGFIDAYVAELNSRTSSIRDYLTDIRNYEDFTVGDIKLPNMDSTSVDVYSSGAITSKSDIAFNITTKDTSDSVVAEKLLGHNAPVTAADVNAINLSDELANHYNYVKWSLRDLSGAVDADEVAYIRTYAASSTYGESAITPINSYFNFDKIYTNTDICPSSSTSSFGTYYDLTSGYKVWVSNYDVSVKATDADSDGVVRGIIFTKGNVYFATGVTKFEGLVVAGDKVFFNGSMTTISSNPEICKAIIRELQYESDSAKKATAQSILDIFKGYSIIDNGSINSNDAKTIDMIDYSDVIRYDNWMKNVE